MKTILIPKPAGDSLVEQLSSFYMTLKGLDGAEKICFDLSNLVWACPVLLTPLAAYIQTTSSTFKIPHSHPIKPYLESIQFPDGIDFISPSAMIWQREKTYLPIEVLKKEAGADRERLESLFADMVLKIMDAVPGTQSSIYYPMSELVANIFDHSNAGKGFIFGQYYPKKEYLDICIVDRGRGLSKTYADEKNVILSDKEAIEQVMRGVSTKSPERGYGVRTSKRIICEGLHGGYIMISGGGAFVAVRKQERLVELPKFHWQGVIIAYRIPKPTTPLDITPYLE